MYSIDDVVLTYDRVKDGYVITSSIITEVTKTYSRNTYTIDDIWMITNLNEFAPDIGIDINEETILKKVTEDYTKDDFKREYPEHFI
jgi:hypothetical protein